MPTLTRENAKHHCRTCLVNLGTRGGVGHNDNNETDEEFKTDIFINVTTNSELQQIISKYVDEEQEDVRTQQEFPQNLCLGCYNKLQAFEKFRKRAQDSAEKLYMVLSSGVTKVEIDYDDRGEDEARVINNDDIYKLLLKDTLMETESVMLDSSAVATLASVEMHDPDPFGTSGPSAKDLSGSVEFSEDEEDDDEEEPEDGFDWQKNSGQASENNESSSEASEDSQEESDEDAKKKKKRAKKTELEKCEARLQSKRNDATGPKPEKKKKRRTKKEMEEWRRSQAQATDKIETTKIKRRNKGTKNSFKCTQCNHCFAHKITLDAHVRKVHEGSKRPYQCDRCDKAYTFIGGLYTHIKEIHESEVRSYSCDHPGCDRIYTSFIAMQKHKRLKHTDIGYQKKYVCEQCGATFNQTGNLKYHRRTKHPTEAEQAEKEKTKERYECTICNKIFHSRYTLKYHTLQLHSNDMKYECNICGRRMAKKFMLVQHMLVHSTDKMPCEHCGKQFIRKFELEAHIRAVHMKLKPFECQYCSECFASRKTLRHHEYIHTGEKPYVCDICGQAYRQQTCLKNHRKSHEKLSAEALLAANINRTLMNTFLAPASAQPSAGVAGPSFN